MRTARAIIILIAFVSPLSAVAQEAVVIRDVYQRINVERVRNRLKPLKYNKTLEKAAQFHADWMAHNQKMEHLEEAPKNLDEHKTGNHHPVNRAINAGYIQWGDVFRQEDRPDGQIAHAKEDANDYIGEIIAAGWDAGDPATQPPKVVPGWSKSPGHHKEILTAHYQEMGIAWAKNGNNTFWCVVFGRPKK